MAPNATNDRSIAALSLAADALAAKLRAEGVALTSVGVAGPEEKGPAVWAVALTDASQIEVARAAVGRLGGRWVSVERDRQLGAQTHTHTAYFFFESHAPFPLPAGFAERAASTAAETGALRAMLSARGLGVGGVFRLARGSWVVLVEHDVPTDDPRRYARDALVAAGARDIRRCTLGGRPALAFSLDLRAAPGARS